MRWGSGGGGTTTSGAVDFFMVRWTGLCEGKRTVTI
jgi:hypothetical protein